MNISINREMYSSFLCFKMLPVGSSFPVWNVGDGNLQLELQWEQVKAARPEALSKTFHSKFCIFFYELLYIIYFVISRKSLELQIHLPLFYSCWDFEQCAVLNQLQHVLSLCFCLLMWLFHLIFLFSLPGSHLHF
jgi:hypothetical protein